MKNTLGSLAILLAWASEILAGALPADWKNVQTIELPKAGAFRFSIPTATLDACRLGLEDLRFFDDQGRELPYLIERPSELRPRILPGREFRASKSAGKNILTFDTRTDRPVRGVNLLTPVAKFQKTVMIEGSPDGNKWIILAKGEPIFRELSGTHRLLVEFPPTVCEELRLTIEEPPGSVRTTITGAEIHTAPDGPLVTEPLDLTIVERDNIGGSTRLKLRSPVGSFTLAELAVQTSEPSFARIMRLAVSAREGTQIKETEVWHDTIYRLPVANYPTATKLGLTPDLPIIGRDLILTIENHDQPPLNITGVSASRRPVYLVVLASAAGKYHLLSGNPTAARPSYDLAGVVASGAPELLNSMKVSKLASNPAHRATPSTKVTTADNGSWKYRKRIEFTGGGNIHEVELDLDVLTHATRTLQDVRIHSDGKVIPCVIQTGSELNSLTPTVTAENATQPTKTSRWSIQLPRAGLPLTQLECTTAANVFKRFMQLSEHRTGERSQPQEVALGKSEWVRASEEPEGRMSMTITQSPQTDRLLLSTDNGGNAPIVLDKFQVWYPRAFVVFKAAPGAATYLYYGNADAAAPPEEPSLALELSAAKKSPAKLGREEAVKIRQ